MGILSIIAVGLFAALANIGSALVVSKLLPVGFAVGVTIVDSMFALISTFATSNALLAASSLFAALIAMLAKIASEMTVDD